MLITKITKAVFDTLPAVLQAEYTVADATKPDEFLLQTDDLRELRNSKQREVTAHAATAAKLEAATQAQKDAEKALADYQTANPAKAEADAAWLRKLEAQKAADAKVVELKDKLLRETILENTVQKIVGEITDAPELLAPHVAKRVIVDTTGEKPVVKFLAEDGLESASNLEEFRKEIAEDKRFARLITGSKASGGGATGGRQGSGSGAGVTKKFADMNEQERTHLWNTNPNEFARLSAADKQERTSGTYGRVALIR